jgi:acyl carrier protein
MMTNTGQKMAGEGGSGAADVSAEQRQEIERRILDVIAREGMVPREKLTPDATLESLSISSIDVVSILMGLEEEFDVYVPVDGDLAMAKDVQELLSSLTHLVIEKNAGQSADHV